MALDYTNPIERLDVPVHELVAQLAEQRHQYLDLDPDSACPLPGCTPACLPAGTTPPGGSDG